MSKNIPVILDNGSGIFKAGFAEDFNCSTTFPTIIGTPKNSNLIIGMDQKDFFVGQEANNKRNLLNIYQPIQKGFIQDWEKMQQIWEYTFETKLAIDPQDSPILTSEPPNSSKEYKEKMAEMFFEVFKGENYYSQVTSVLALFSTGRTTGLILESGQGITHAVPIFEGFSIPFATIKLDIGGDYLTNHLIELLKESKDNPTLKDNEYEKQIFNEIKEKYCNIAFDYDSSVKEFQKNKKTINSTTLPDGTEIILTDQTFKCPEILFQPNKTDKDFYGIHEAVFQAILRCNPGIRKELYSNIQLSGGNTMFPGINQRLFKEISALAPSTMDIKTKAPQERKHSVWIGGSILCSLNHFKNMWISSRDYKEYGASIIHRKIIQL